jgi:hypothetical protein
VRNGGSIPNIRPSEIGMRANREHHEYDPARTGLKRTRTVRSCGLEQVAYCRIVSEAEMTPSQKASAPVVDQGACQYSSTESAVLGRKALVVCAAEAAAFSP